MFYEDKKLNKKHVIIVVLIVICIIALIAGSIIYNLNKNKESFTTINSNDGKISMQIPNTINFRTNTSKTNDFSIDLFSDEDNMYMYATTIEKARELDLLEVATNDKTTYFKDKENLRDDSGFIQTNISGNTAIEYSLVYYDSNFNKDFYCNVVWVETDNYIYVFNFEVSNENAEQYKIIFNNMKNSIVFN